MNKNIDIDLLNKLYTEMTQSEKNYKNSLNIISCKEFIEKENIFYNKLDQYYIDLSNWSENNEKYNVCNRCNYKFILCNQNYNTLNIIHRKKIHNLFFCKNNM